MGIADSGADVSRLGGTRDRLQLRNFTQGSVTTVPDELNHGTMVASLIAGSRSDLNISGVAPDAGLAIARIVKLGACNATTIAQNLIAAFTWFRSIGDVQIVNVSANIPPNQALIESLRALQQTGTLVVAATGNFGESREGHLPRVPAARARGRGAWQQHEEGVGELGARAAGRPRRAGHRLGRDRVVARHSHRAVRRDPRRNLVRQPARRRCCGPRLGQAPGVGREPRLCGVDLLGEAPLRRAAQQHLGLRTARRQGRARRVAPGGPRRAERLGLRGEGPCPLVHKVQLAARVGGNDDPLDAYPIDTMGSLTVRIVGKAPLTAYLLRDTSLSAIDKPTSLRAAASSTKAGTSVRLRVPRLGRWYVVVTAPKSLTPVGYTLRVG